MLSDNSFQGDLISAIWYEPSKPNNNTNSVNDLFLIL